MSIDTSCAAASVFIDSERDVSSKVAKDIDIIVKLREREGQRVDSGRSLKGHL